MKRVLRWTLTTTLTWVLACALPAWPGDDAGQRSSGAGHNGGGLAEWQPLQTPGRAEALDVPQYSDESHRWRRLAANRGQVLVATAGPPPEAIREAQELLAKLGYKPGPANGMWNRRSIQAYREFLRDQGRPDSSKLTRKALNVMRRLVERQGGGVAPRESPRRRSESRPARRETATYSDGSRYEGDIRDGKRHGQGTFIWAEGGRYEGEWRNDKRTGWGTETWTNGNRYEGEYLDNRLHGRGTFIWAEGGRYEGDFRDGKRTGWGIHFHANGNRYEGAVVDGKAHGRGTYTWADGGRYEGDWRDNKRRGWGTKTWASGSHYEGEWQNNKPNGQGTLTASDGRRWKGQWRNGCFGKKGGEWAFAETTAAACGFE